MVVGEVKTNGWVGPEVQEVPLYDPALLASLDWTPVTYMKGGITSHNPGPGFKVRPLQKGDYDKGFLQLLSHLTKVGDVSREQFEARFDQMRSCPGHYYVTVVEDLNLGKVIASATLAVEYKFIRGCAKRGRLEDVVVNEDYRGRQLGKLIVSTITLLAQHEGCYKMGLDCTDTMKAFYATFGYSSEKGNDNTMIIRFPDTSSLPSPASTSEPALSNGTASANGGASPSPVAAL